MQMNHVPQRSRDHHDSECVSHMAVDHKGAEFIGKNHTNTQLYILLQFKVLFFT